MFEVSMEFVWVAALISGHLLCVTLFLLVMWRTDDFNKKTKKIILGLSVTSSIIFGLCASTISNYYYYLSVSEKREAKHVRNDKEVVTQNWLFTVYCPTKENDK